MKSDSNDLSLAKYDRFIILLLHEFIFLNYKLVFTILRLGKECIHYISLSLIILCILLVIIPITK